MIFRALWIFPVAEELGGHNKGHDTRAPGGSAESGKVVTDPSLIGFWLARSLGLIFDEPMAGRNKVAFSGISWRSSPQLVTVYSSRATLLMMFVWFWVAYFFSLEYWPAGAMYIGLPLLLFTCVPYKVAEISAQDMTFYPMLGMFAESVPQGVFVVSEQPKSFFMGGDFGPIGLSQSQTVVEFQDNQGKVLWRRRFFAAADPKDFAPLLEQIAALRNAKL
jgi:hypothetical protein